MNHSPLRSQFSIWKKNMFIPLTDQLKEQAERKVKEVQEQQFIDANKDQAFFKASKDGGVHDIEAQKKRNERHQAILRQTIQQEKGAKPEDIDFVKPEYDDGDPYKETVDKLPVKRKQKWRLW